MSHRFIEEEATADVAFEATGRDLPEVFRSAVDAVVNVMIENYLEIEPAESRTIEAESEELDLLLFDLLQSIVYYKDAEQLLLRLKAATVERTDSLWRLRAEAKGEVLDLERHRQWADVKAVTLHDFRLQQFENGWRAHVIVDV